MRSLEDRESLVFCPVDLPQNTLLGHRRVINWAAHPYANENLGTPPCGFVFFSLIFLNLDYW